MLSLLALLLVGCATPTAHGFDVRPAPAEPVATPRPIAFPADEAPHDNLSEWWYYTGHLATESGKRYGFELVFFQAVRGRNPVGYAAHFAVTDHQRQSFFFDQRSDKALQVQGEGRFQLAVAGWRMGEESDEHYLQAQAEGYGIDLRLRSLKPPVLHAGSGWISFGPVGDSYYYSLTRMEVSGTLEAGGAPERAGGFAWMDHQWGDFVLVNGGGWDWFSIQLEDGTEAMVTVLRDRPGNVAATYGSYVDEAGRAADLTSGDLEVKATGSWRSPRSGADYPSGWTLRFPGQGLNLTLQPVLQDQELNALETTGTNYWEGEVRVTGTRDGSSVSGDGYVELTGYSP